MDTVEDLERRLSILEATCRRLEDINQIKKTRYSYWRYIRDGQYDELIDLFAEDASVNLGPVGGQASGKPAIAKLYNTIFLQNNSAKMSFPRGFDPEIDIVGDDIAVGIWLGEAPRIEPENERVSNVGFIYNEEYRREDGHWKIKKLDISYSFTAETKLVLPQSVRK